MRYGLVCLVLALAACGPVAEPQAADSESETHSTQPPDEVSDPEPVVDREALAQELCRDRAMVLASELDTGSRLVASHAATAREFSEWEQTRSGEDGPRPAPRLRAEPDDLVALCYFEGDYAFPGPPPPVDAPETWQPPRWSTVGITVTEDGRTEIYSGSLAGAIDPNRAAPGKDDAVASESVGGG